MWYQPLLDAGVLPDRMLRWGIRRLLAQRLQDVSCGSEEERRKRLAAFAEELRQSPIAANTREANEQHYEVPSAFYRLVLGPHLKYSCGYWPDGVTDLAESEKAMLDLTAQRAGITAGQSVLDLGCGWGAFSLYVAERYPSCRIVSVSNSRTQKEYIESELRRRGLHNVTVVTADANTFVTAQRFDRIVSVEMFEHMRNYEKLLARVAGFMKPDARLFVHIFAHERYAYPFEITGDHDWMARYFFTGGIMPSRDLLPLFDRDVLLEDQWTLNGTHYERTCNAWLARMDVARDEIMGLFRDVYGPDQARTWWSYWRIFFMSCAELFGYRGGSEWLVAHYRFGLRSERKQPVP